MSEFITISHSNKIDSLFTYAAGYYNSGLLLIEILLDENRYSQLSDFLEDFRKESIKLEEECNIYPVMFLFRQYLELIIKALYLYFEISDNDNYYNNRKRLFENHRISEIWPGLMKKLLLEEQKCTDLSGITKILDEIVQRFVSIDDNSYCFRYPFDIKNNFYFKNDKYYNLKRIKSDITLFDDLIHEFV